MTQTAPANLPQDITQSLVNDQAEQALLANLLRNNLSSEKIDHLLKPEHFADALHGRLFKVIMQLIDQGKSANPVTIREYFKDDEDFKAVGGIKYLSDIAQNYSAVVSIKDYAQLIYDLFIRRNLVNIGEDLATTAQKFSFEESSSDKIENTEKKLFDLATQGSSSRQFKSFSTALGEAIGLAEIAYKRDSQVVGCTTGLRDFDKWLGGLHPSDLVIVAGRPSMGKTGLATNIGFNAALAHHLRGEGGKVAFFSLEMSAEQLAMRLLSQESQIPSDRIRRGEINKTDFPKFVEVSQRVSEIPLFIDDTPALTVAAVRARARRLHRTEGLGLIIIDYLQLLQGNTRTDNRVQEISEISRGLKALAKELHIPVIALSQLSRAVETRDDKRPQLSDLRESGSIEQDADVVVFVYREEYYEARKEPAEDSEDHSRWQERMSKVYNQADLIIAKQRHGPIGTVRVFYDGKFTKFGNLSHD